ncbi:hypothetical protein RND81_05G146200 [Saponaria officinalis]|uniref:Uncharacterized protein n=1 Tax=Saponaria officinalis TaxID=3572 RepID=A0AAW1KYM3_SAPOF
MEDKMKVEIQIISKETIKPSSPTPSHLKTFKLSLIDQIFPAFHIPLLLFYTTPSETRPRQISTLKSSLSETLSHFYPLAGRCIDDSTVCCDDQGIPFVETYINSRLCEIVNSSSKVTLLQQFLPPREFLALGPRPISDLVPLAFQINVFQCGGIVIGCYMLHKLLDASSLGTFFQHWACRGQGNAVGPDFDAIFKAFPPDPSIKQVVVPDLCKDPSAGSPPMVVLVKSFRLSKAGISRLKEKGASEGYENPTSFETVAGFVWENVVAAARSTRTADSTVLSITINMRSRTNPTLPAESMGNCITEVHAKATGVRTFPELVMEIHEAVLKTNLKIEKFQGENGVEEICADREAASRFVTEDDGCVYQLSSWCRLGLEKADFGFGKPNWIIPTDGIIPVSLRNFIFFTDYSDASGDGVEVWLFLEEKEMRILESNTKFIEFASPN